MSAPPSEPQRRGEATTLERLLIFAIGGQEFAVPIEPIVEIVRHRPPTPVPGADPSVEGILPLRGRMVTVIDARRRLGLGGRERSGGAQVIVMDDAGEWVGLVVDAVARVATIPAAERQPLPAALGLARPEFYHGVLRREGSYVVLLDLARLLQAER